MDVCVLLMNTKEIRETFANAETVVYWDVEDFPVTDIVSFNQNIKLALANAGYLGKVSITAYGQKKPDDEYYKNAGITFVPKASKRARMHRMLVDMHFWAADNLACAPTNLMVIAKNIMPADDDDDTQFAYYLGAMNSICYNVLLAVPDDYQLEKMPFECNYTVWLWSDLCARGNPLDRSLVYRQLPQDNRQPPQDIEGNRCSQCGK